MQLTLSAIESTFTSMFDVKDTDFFELEEEEFDTVLANDISFTGKIRFQKPFMIKGHVTGTIDAESDLVIDSKASVEATISARRILVRGSVKGDISADCLVFVASTGSVDGDITTDQLVLEPGSTFSGRCSMK